MGTPAGKNDRPHEPDAQNRTAHSVSVPGQSAAVRQPTHWPTPLQSSPGPHEVPAGEST